MAASRVIQVIEANVLLRPDRYAAYHRDLVELLSDAMAAAGDGISVAERRRDLADSVRAKASQIGPLS